MNTIFNVDFITNKSMVLANRTHYWQETRVPVLVKLLELVWTSLAAINYSYHIIYMT